MKNFKNQFGAKVTAELEAHYAQSDNWKNGKFQNLEKTNTSLSFWEMSELLYKQVTNKAQREPQNPLPILPFDRAKFISDDVDLRFAWYGHSVLLLRVNTTTILIDPMLGPNASPIAPFKTKRFSRNSLEFIDNFPQVDLMIISHDHYDHLDYDSIVRTKDKTSRYFVALGVKRHLVKWGIEPEKIKEFDWYQDFLFGGIKIINTPTRHFSGRGLHDRAKSLWGGWIFKTAKLNIWFSGDGGYGQHFKEIGNRYGPFNLAFMECGQYNEKWRPLHLFPEESVQAALDAGVRTAMPVHWAGFALSQHSWMEPIEEFLKFARLHNLAVMYPSLGQIVELDHLDDQKKWWREV